MIEPVHFDSSVGRFAFVARLVVARDGDMALSENRHLIFGAQAPMVREEPVN